MSEQFMKLEVKGVANDAHVNFPINFAYSDSGVAYFTGCKITTKQVFGEKTVTKNIDIVAFREVAEELASVSDGTEIHVKGEFGKRKANDGKWYDQLVVDEVISIG